MEERVRGGRKRQTVIPLNGKNQKLICIRKSEEKNKDAIEGNRCVSK